ncbi:Serine/Threonine protein kinase, partial [Candidatus Thiomargarita nelsonii]
TTLDKIEKDVETTKAVAIENNAILQALYGLMAQRGLSSRVSPRDEFTQYDNESQQLIEAAVEQLGQLPTPEYSQVSIKVGTALSSTGNLEKAERLFIQAIEKAQNQEDKALAYFNIFQVRWRKAFAEVTVSAKETYYAKALSALENAIDLSNGRYALHDTHKGYYPIEKFLGAGGMGCALLCQNNNDLINGHKRVVVKCFWENIAGTLREVFKEPFAMAQIAGEFVPKPLDYGYADNVNQKGPYFVTEYVEGAIDGEAWLEKNGPLSLKIGLQVGLQVAEGLRRAHEAGIYHLDLKPANLLLKQTDGGIAVKIIDFGLSRVTTSLRDVAVQRSQSSKSVFEQAVFGTLEYAPPEQRGYARQFGVPGAKSDIFA